MDSYTSGYLLRNNLPVLAVFLLCYYAHDCYCTPPSLFFLLFSSSSHKITSPETLLSEKSTLVTGISYLIRLWGLVNTGNEQRLCEAEWGFTVTPFDSCLGAWDSIICQTRLCAIKTNQEAVKLISAWLSEHKSHVVNDSWVGSSS